MKYWKKQYIKFKHIILFSNCKKCLKTNLNDLVEDLLEDWKDSWDCSSCSSPRNHRESTSEDSSQTSTSTTEFDVEEQIECYRNMDKYDNVISQLNDNFKTRHDDNNLKIILSDCWKKQADDSENLNDKLLEEHYKNWYDGLIVNTNSYHDGLNTNSYHSYIPPFITKRHQTKTSSGDCNLKTTSP